MNIRSLFKARRFFFPIAYRSKSFFHEKIPEVFSFNAFYKQIVPLGHSCLSNNRRSRRSRLHHSQSTSCFIIESSVYRRPGGEAFWCVLCVLWLKFVFIRVHSWLIINGLQLVSQNGNIRHKNAAWRHMDRLAVRFIAQQPSIARTKFAARKLRADRDGHIVSTNLVGRCRIARNA